MNNQDLTYESARTAVESILNVLGVIRVVYVDDWNAVIPTVEQTVEAAKTIIKIIGPTKLQPLFPELGETAIDDLDLLGKKIRETWPVLDSDVQSERGKTIIATARLYDASEIDDTADIAALEQIIPQNKLVSLSPSEWDDQQEKLLSESQMARTLFIFDRDLSRAGGEPESGIKIIASLLAKKNVDGIICGLLTHTVTPETQFEQWENLSIEHSISKDRFVVIPKRHLSQSPVLFAQRLKFAVLAPDFSKLKSKTREIIAKAVRFAEDRVERINIYDLDHIVFQVPTNEGLWEPDMLFRLYTMFHRLESRQLAYNDGELEKITAKMRDLSEIPTNGKLLSIPSSAWSLQREELYESDKYINNNNLPLELGDIFEKIGGNSNKKYILLAQPCDLMVRSDGERHPEPQRVPLVEIVPANKAKPPCPEEKCPLVCVAGRTIQPPHSEEMPYFDLSPEKIWFVKFKYIHFVSSSILDLCVFNQDGEAKLTIDGNIPTGIRPAWEKRHKFLSKRYKQVLCKVDILSHKQGDTADIKELKQKLAEDINRDGLLFEENLFKGNFTKLDGLYTVKFNFKRVGRLSYARAIGLLMSYTATLGRPAYERDFGKV